MDTAAHWERIYGLRSPEEQGWFTNVPQPSLQWILAASDRPDNRIVDAGGGASYLVDHLLRAGLSNVCVIDLSSKALELAKERLGSDAALVDWSQADVCQAPVAAGSVDIWHDRAVFHFLHDTAERTAYKDSLLRSLTESGTVIIGSFRPGAPPKCSGLPVRHHTGEQLAEFFAPEFIVEGQLESVHTTPGGVEQAYVFMRMRRA